MEEPIEEVYFEWLCAKVMPKSSDNYNGLLQVLHRTEFVWVVVGDKNRAEDGLELRLDFLRETNYLREREWFECGCSVLECLIAFAKRASFQTDISVEEWFWTFIRNLGLEEYRRISESDIPVITEVLEAFVWRNYKSNGDGGGLFPMRSPEKDQRKVEIWYQFCEYLEDQGLM